MDLASFLKNAARSGKDSLERAIKYCKELLGQEPTPGSYDSLKEDADRNDSEHIKVKENLYKKIF